MAKPEYSKFIRVVGGVEVLFAFAEIATPRLLNIIGDGAHAGKTLSEVAFFNMPSKKNNHTWILLSSAQGSFGRSHPADDAELDEWSSNGLQDAINVPLSQWKTYEEFLAGVDNGDG